MNKFQEDCKRLREGIIAANSLFVYTERDKELRQAINPFFDNAVDKLDTKIRGKFFARMHRSLSGQHWRDLKTDPWSLELFLKEFDSRTILFSSEEIIAEIREEMQEKEQETEEKKERKTTADIVVVREKIKKQNEKFLKALKAGARLAEVSSSKIAWDKGHDKLEVKSGKFDYRTHQVLDCAADSIAQEYWIASVFDPSIEANTKELDHFFVPIEYRQFLSFINDRNDLSTKDVTKIFKKMPEIILEGEVNIPYVSSEGYWMRIDKYIDNICGVAIAHEDGKFDEYRSKRHMRGRGAGKEEPVFVLIFSSPYGKAFFHNSMLRKGTQLQDPKLYHLRPEAQSLFQAVRWNDGLIAMNTKQASQMMNLKWPVSKTNLYKRVDLIRRILKILKDERFIN